MQNLFLSGISIYNTMQQHYNRDLKIYSDLMQHKPPIGIVGHSGRQPRKHGQGLKLSGQGWRTGLGSTLVTLGGLGAAGNLDTKPVEGLLGGAVLGGIGGWLIHSDKKKKGKGMVGSGQKIFKQKMIAHLKDILQKAPHHVGKGYSGSGKIKKITKKDIEKFIQSHQHKPIHIKDIFGSQWKSKGKHLIDIIQKTHSQQEGGNIFSDIGHTFKKGFEAVGKTAKKVYHGAKHVRDQAFHELKRFANGKTKFKPSQLANYLAAGVGALGTASAFIPGVDLISVPAASAAALGLKSAGLALKTSGRGFEDLIDYSELGIPGMEDPANLPEVLSRLASSGSELSKTKLGLALGITGAALAGAYTLYKKIRKGMSGRGTVLSGGAQLPPKHLAFIKKYPAKARKVLEQLQGQHGSGILKKAAVGVGGLALYGFLKENPHLIDQLANAIKTHLTGGAMPQMPKKIQNYLSKHPMIAKQIAQASMTNKQLGSGTASRFAAALGIAGTSAAAGAYGLYQYLLNNPATAAKIAGKATGAAISGWFGQGAGLSLSGGQHLPMGCKRLPSGKIKCDKYSVWAGIHKKTRGGLTKADLMLKGKKVISKKKHQQGLKMMQQGKGLYK